MKLCFTPHTFYREKAALVEECDRICNDYHRRGYSLTLRQLYYQLVTRNRIANNIDEYKRLTVTMTEARYGGHIDWDMLCDHLRALQALAHWEDAAHRLKDASNTMQIDTLAGQLYRPEVWIEKDALIEVAGKASIPWDVPYREVKAYDSVSQLWQARGRFLDYLANGQEPLILHIGDHDYTGWDASRHLQEAMSLLVGRPVELRRLGLNMDQIKKYNLPPNPGKIDDPRKDAYVKQFGTKDTWELDALDPEVIEGLITDALIGTDDKPGGVIDTDIRGLYLNQQAGYTAEIQHMSENYDPITSDGCKAWLSLTDMATNGNKGLTANLPIGRFHKPIVPFAPEMDAETAARYFEALWPTIGEPWPNQGESA